MADSAVVNYLKGRRAGVRGLKSPYIKFTLAKLESLPVESFDYEVRALEPLAGLICRIRPSGVKSLEVFRKPSGSHKPVRTKIGRVGDLPLTGGAKSVKRVLQGVLRDLADGVNPNDTKRARAIEDSAGKLTVHAALEAYLRVSSLKDTTRSNYQRGICNNMSAEMDVPIAELLDKGTLSSIHDRITRQAGPYAANSTMRILRAIANAAREDHEDSAGNSPIPSWPIQGRNKSKRFWNKETRRTGWVKPEYLADWWEATERLPQEHPGDGATARDYLQFVLLSGLRRREATKLDWADIDFRSRSLRVEETKSGQALELPLSDYMLEILRRRRSAKTLGPFKIEEPKKFVNWVRRQSGVHFTVHDLRRSFITYAERLDFGSYTIKALVNHASENSQDVTEGYVQLDVERLRAPMQKIADYVLSHAGVRRSDLVELKR